MLRFGENRVQELVAKRDELERLRPGCGATWDLIGPLQSNKVRLAMTAANRIATIDSLDLLERVERIAVERGAPMHIAVQVNVDADPAKAGFSAEEFPRRLPALLAAIGRGFVVIDGVLTVGRQTSDIAVVRRTFTALHTVAQELHAAALSAGVAVGPLISAGMSNDFELAIEEGSTQVRIGSALFGARE